MELSRQESRNSSVNKYGAEQAGITSSAGNNHGAEQAGITQLSMQ